MALVLHVKAGKDIQEVRTPLRSWIRLRTVKQNIKLVRVVNIASKQQRSLASRYHSDPS